MTEQEFADQMEHTAWLNSRNRNDEPYPTDYVKSLHGDPVWEAIWQSIKGWDIQRENGVGYHAPTGDDVTQIYEAVKAAAK